MEKANGRNNSPANYNWRGFLESAQKSMEAAATRDGDPIVNAVKIAQVASTLYDMTIRPQDVAKLLHCAALVVSSNDLTNNDKHRLSLQRGPYWLNYLNRKATLTWLNCVWLARLPINL